MTVILSIALWLVEPRRWVKVFAVAAVIAVCGQGLLGWTAGRSPQGRDRRFSCVAGAIVLRGDLNSRDRDESVFAEKRWADYEPHPSLRWWALATTALIFVQLGIGATMRHEHIGLSIPDFPLAYGDWLPDTSSASIERINAQRIADGEMQTDAAQIWIQMTHRILALLIAVAVGLFAGKPAGARESFGCGHGSGSR